MAFKPRLLFIATAAHLVSPSAQAAVIYWDGGTGNIAAAGNGVSAGGTGTWGGSIKNWDIGNNLAHASSTKRDTAVFGGVFGTVTTSGSFTTAGLQSISDGYTLALSGGILTIGSAGVVAHGSTTITGGVKLGAAQAWTAAAAKTLNVSSTVNNNGRLLTIAGAGNTTLSGVISGSSGLTKSGAGFLTLSGANTYSGVSTIAGGILNLGSTESSGTSGPLGMPGSLSGSLLITGGTLQYSSVNAFDYSNRFSTAGGQSWSIDTNGRNVTFGTALAGASSLTKIGTGTLTLSVNNTFNGGTTIRSGVLNVSGGLADSGFVTVNGGTYTVAASDTIGTLTLTSGTINGSSALTASTYSVLDGSVSPSLGGSAGLTKTTTGTVSLSGANTYTGGTNINGGVLNVTGSLADTGAVNVNGGTYRVGANDTVGALTLTSGTIDGTGTLTATSYALQSGNIDTALAGFGGLVKSTGGTVTLSKGNNYSGGTSIQGGTLSVNGTIASASAVSVGSGGTLSGRGTVAGAVTVANSSTATLVAGDGTSGMLTLGSLSFSGAGTIRIGPLGNYTSSSALTVTGSLTLNGAAGGVAITLPGGTMNEGSYHLITNPLTNFSGFSVTGATLGARQLANLVNENGVIKYVVIGANPYWTGAAGSEWSTATISGNKNWELSVTQTTDFRTNDAVVFDDRAVSTSVFIASSVSPNVVSFNAGKNYFLEGNAGITSGVLTKARSGTLTITNANSYSGGTTLSAGVLQVGNNGALGSGLITLAGGILSSNTTTARTMGNALAIGGDISLGNATNNGLMTFTGAVNLGGSSRHVVTPSNVTLSGVVSNGGLIKSGEGILTLSGSNTYTGGTITDAGTLAINSATSLGATSGSLTVAGNSSLLFNSNVTSSRGYSLNSGVTGTLALAGGAAIPDAGAIVMLNSAGASLQLNASETIRSLSGGGILGGGLNLQSNTLTVTPASDTSYQGVISG